MVNWYLVIPFSDTVPNPFIADSSDLKGFSEWDFMKGGTIENWNKEAWLKAEKPVNNGVPDDVLSNLHALLVLSARLQEALLSTGISGIQLLPVKVFQGSGEEISGFAIANILNVVSALDFRRSEVEFFPEDHFLPQKRGKVRDVGRTVLLGSALAGFDVIRIPELPPDVYVSERFMDVFKRGGFTGLSFEPVDVS